MNYIKCVFSELSFQSGQSAGISPSNLSHDLVEEKHSDDQETQNPPIGICREKDREESRDQQTE